MLTSSWQNPHAVLVSSVEVAQVVGFLEKPWPYQLPNNPILTQHHLKQLREDWATFSRTHKIKLRW